MKHTLLSFFCLAISNMCLNAQKYDPAFNGAGWVTENITNDAQNFGDLVVQADHKVLAAGLCLDANDQYQPFIIRYEVNGSRDNNFGAGGINKLNLDPTGVGAPKIAVNSSGQVYLTASQGNANGPFYLVRLKADGTPDNQFGNSGVLVDSVGVGLDFEHVYTINVQPDNKILLSGFVTSASQKRTDIWMIRYKPNGTRDSSFGTNGLIKLNPYAAYYGSGSVNRDLHIPNRVLLLSGGKILIGGKYRSYTQLKDDFLLVRLNADGSYDKTFGAMQQGVVILGMQDIEQVAGMALQKDSSIVFGGPCGNGYTTIRLVRLTKNGLADPTFGTKVTSTGNWGYTTFDLEKYASQGVTDLVVMPDDKIMMGGFWASNYMVVYKFSANGVVDSTYGKWGRIDTSFKSQGQNCNAIALDLAKGRLYVGGSAFGGGSSFCYLAAVKIGESVNTGVNVHVKQNAFQVYPNPACTSLEIVMPEEGELHLYNATGQCVYEGDSHHDSINVSEFPNGLYVARLTSGNRVYTSQVIIQH